jgi:hypothetical protein
MSTQGPEICVAEGISTADEIMGLAGEAKRLIGDELGPLCPQFFLATIRLDCFPRVVVVRRASKVVGIVYATERKLAGFRTGLIFADARLGPIIVSKPEEREAVWRTALSYLLTRKTVLGVRLAVPFTDYELYAGETIVRPIGAVASYRDEERSNAILRLGPSYGEFLSQLGPHTRRNFRYYRRQFEKNGHAYVEPMTIQEFHAAALELTGKSSIWEQRTILEFNARICSTVDRPILVGLRACSGEWLAILAGWYNRDQPSLYFQMNRDQDYRTDSLSIVLRGYLIESLIQRGFQHIVFLYGVKGPLMRYCHFIHTIGLYLDKPHGFLSPTRFLGLAARLLPKSLMQHADWIANLNPQGQSPAFREPRKTVSTQ